MEGERSRASSRWSKCGLYMHVLKALGIKITVNISGKQTYQGDKLFGASVLSRFSMGSIKWLGLGAKPKAKERQ